jgi:hypothetical protein
MRGGTKKPRTRKPKTDNAADSSLKNKKVSLSVRVKKSVKKSRKPAAANRPAESVDNGQPLFDSGRTDTQPVRIISEKIESQKNLVMWTGVAFFMTLIFVLWIFNLKQEFKKVSATSQEVDVMENWDQMSKEMGQKLEEMKTELEAVKEFGENEVLSDIMDTATSTASTTPDTASSALFSLPETQNATSTATSSQAEIEILKQKLESLEKKINQAN